VALTPQRDLRDPIIKVLGQRGGAAQREVVLADLEVLLGSKLSDEDRKPPKSRPFEENWMNRASYERAAMKRDGLLRHDSVHGMWELSEAGWDSYRA